MRHAIALGEIGITDESVPELVLESADGGFDVMSFSPQQLLKMGAGQKKALTRLLDARGLGVVLHGGFDVEIEDLRALVDMLQGRLLDITFDAELHWTTAGYLFNVEKMCPYLQQLDTLARSHGFCYGMEDFPEGSRAVDVYAEQLQLLFDSPRFGILIDVGHLHQSMHGFGYINPSFEEHFAQLPCKLLEVHLHDNDGRNDLHLPLGASSIDFKAVAHGLDAIDFDGVCTVEVIPSQHGGTFADARRQSVESLKFWQRLTAQHVEHRT